MEETVEQQTSAFYEAECRQGRTPTGADLDRIASTQLRPPHPAQLRSVGQLPLGY
ncbi:hypothetical protein ACIA5G_14895 [Amycolatopsis sp. NPDC051758]|uniref:hypothetical protein n=1 Tax=Amycolatopsis sp. NPDC051758 TaxID=3363935 RepID=UPI0037AA1A3C